MKYNDYLLKLSTRFQGLFSEIAANYNFDYGVEFEIAICVALRAILPERFGVCRGFAVPEDGISVGDDIIIYDRSRFPTLRLLEQNTFAGKEEIPAEAVCAYIEAKHTLHLDGNMKDGQSFVKAEAQIRRVKQIVYSRQPLILNASANHVDLPSHVPNESRLARLDLCFGAIIARNVKRTQRCHKQATPVEIREIVRRPASPQNRFYISAADCGITDAPNPDTGPDLIVLGDSNIILPYRLLGDVPIYITPYHSPPDTILAHCIMPDVAFAAGVCSLLYSLDLIHLGSMPYRNIIREAFDLNNPTNAPAPKKGAKRRTRKANNR